MCPDGVVGVIASQNLRIIRAIKILRLFRVTRLLKIIKTVAYTLPLPFLSSLLSAERQGHKG